MKGWFQIQPACSIPRENHQFAIRCLHASFNTTSIQYKGYVVTYADAKSVTKGTLKNIDRSNGCHLFSLDTFLKNQPPKGNDPIIICVETDKKNPFTATKAEDTQKKSSQQKWWRRKRN